MKKIRVAFTQELATSGGASKVLLDIVKYIDRDQFEPIVIVGRRGESIDRFASIAETCFYPEPYNIPKTSYAQKHFLRPFLMPQWFYKTIREQKIDLLYQNGHASELWMRLGHSISVPRILHVHGFHTNQMTRGNVFISLFKNFADQYICCAQDVAIRLETCVGIPPNKLTTLYNGIDVETVQTDAQENFDLSRFGIIEGDILICGAGSLFFNKGIDLFARAAFDLSLRYPNLKFLWIGGSLHDSGAYTHHDYARAVEDYLNRTGLQQKFIFIEHQSNISPILKRADIFVMPSREEALPLVVMEAMAIGKPVVAFPVGGVPEVLEDKYGVLTQGFDPKELAAKIGDLIEQPEKRLQFGELAQNHIKKNFDIRTNIHHFENSILRTIEDRHTTE